MKTRNATISIVDDDASFRKSLKRLLQAMGFQVVAYDSAASFLSNSASHSSDCFIFDVNMPDMDGFSLQEEVVNRGITTPVIFITGHGDAAGGNDDLRKRHADFLMKPFAVAQIDSAITRAVLGRNRG